MLYIGFHKLFIKSFNVFFNYQRLPLQHMSLCNVKRFIQFHKTTRDIFHKQLGLPYFQVDDYMVKNRLTTLQTSSILKIVNCCEAIGYNKNDILSNPKIFRMNILTIEHSHRALIEGGFSKLSLKLITNYRVITQKSISTLKKEGLLNKDTDVAASLISYLVPAPPYLSVASKPSDKWSNLHLKILMEYLKWRLNTSDEQIYNLLSKHSSVGNKSFQFISEVIKLAEEMGFSNEKILKHGYILRANPKDIKKLLEKFPAIDGLSLKQCMVSHPRIMTLTPSQFKHIYTILKEHKITEEMMTKNLNVFLLSPETVQLRLKNLERVEDFKVLLTNPNILKVLVHHNRATSRLAFLKKIHLKCTSLGLLGMGDEKFDIQIREGKDKNSLNDTYWLLRGIFNKHPKDFDSKLKLHPHYVKIPLVTMNDTYDFLKTENFTDEAILNAPYILLYDKHKIQRVCPQIDEFEEHLKCNLTHLQRLNLALYFIEREHHFSGDGVWMKEDGHSETGSDILGSVEA